MCRLCLSTDRKLSSICGKKVIHELIASKLNTCLEYEVSWLNVLECVLIYTSIKNIFKVGSKNLACGL